MNRCKDYFGFAVWFAGIGYVVLWPLAANGNGGGLFGASIVCGDGAGGVMATVCQWPHPVALPLGLHVLGVAAAALLAARLSCLALRRLRPRASIIPAAALNARLPGAIPQRPQNKPAFVSRAVKPRTHFGLRGVPR